MCFNVVQPKNKKVRFRNVSDIRMNRSNDPITKRFQSGITSFFFSSN